MSRKSKLDKLIDYLYSVKPRGGMVQGIQLQIAYWLIMFSPLQKQSRSFPFYYFSLFFEERRKDMLVGYSNGHVFFNYCASHIQIIGCSPEFSLSCKRKKSYCKSRKKKVAGHSWNRVSIFGPRFFSPPLLPLIPLLCFSYSLELSGGKGSGEGWGKEEKKLHIYIFLPFFSNKSRSQEEEKSHT